MNQLTDSEMSQVEFIRSQLGKKFLLLDRSEILRLKQDLTELLAVLLEQHSGFCDIVKLLDKQLACLLERSWEQESV